MSKFDRAGHKNLSPRKIGLASGFVFVYTDLWSALVRARVSPQPSECRGGHSS